MVICRICVNLLIKIDKLRRKILYHSAWDIFTDCNIFLTYEFSGGFERIKSPSEQRTDGGSCHSCKDDAQHVGEGGDVIQIVTQEGEGKVAEVDAEGEFGGV